MSEPSDGRSVFVFEVVDPDGASFRWLEDRDVAVTPGRAAWTDPPRPYDEEEFVAAGRHHTAIMGGSSFRVGQDVIDRLPDLRFISKYGIGVDSIDLEAAERRGILVTNTPIASDFESVAEGTIARILALVKRFDVYTTGRLRQGSARSGSGWPTRIEGLTIGLLGFGRIARAVKRRLDGWGATFIAHDPYVNDFPNDVEAVSLDELLGRSDVLTLHATATPGAHHLIDAVALSKMKPEAFLVNTARGSLLDLDALCDALSQGWLAGAALDVFEQEPIPADHPILRFDNVLATPHVAGWTKHSCAAISQVAAENLLAMFEGDEPQYLVRPAAATKSPT